MPPSLSYFLFNELPGFSLFIPVIVALIFYKNLDNSLKVVLAFEVINFTLSLVNLYCTSHGIHDLIIFHFYAIIEFGFILWFFSYHIDGFLNKAIIPLIGVFAVWSIINFFFIQTGLKLNTYTRPVEAMFIVIYCIAFLNKQISADDTANWNSVSYNWITVAFLSFYACSFFIFIFSNYFLTSGDTLSIYFWRGYTAILIIENLLLATGFYKTRQTS